MTTDKMDAELIADMKHLAKLQYQYHSAHVPAALERGAARIAELAQERADAINDTVTMGQRAEKAEAALAASAKDATRYQYWRGKIEWLEDEGIAGCAYSAQIPLADIDRLSKSELMDAIADRSTARKENAASIGQTEEPRK